MTSKPQRPPDIRITDLAHPVLTREQQAALDAMSGVTVRFTEDEVLTAATRATDLSDFGADDFRARLRVWLAAADEDAGLNALGRLTVFGNCVRALSNRLRLEDLIKRHPEILDVEIRRPIIVVGLPRSGTTHLLNLISADSRLRSLPYWESLEPVPVPGDPPGPNGEDPRLLRCRTASEMQDRMLPLLRNMHHMTPEHVHEEIELQELDFSSYILEWNAMVPRWRDFYLSYDQTPQYRYIKKALQALQWMRGPDRWVLKSPQHLEQLRPLFTVFPDATIAFTHRDPVSVIQSAITMLAYGDRLRRTRVDPPALAAYWIDRIERLLRACVRDRDLIPAAQSHDVLFHEFMADDLATVARIYEKADLPFTPAARAELAAFMDEHPRGKYGQILYDLTGDFGVEPAALRERFAFYFRRFPVRAED